MSHVEIATFDRAMQSPGEAHQRAGGVERAAAAQPQQRRAARAAARLHRRAEGRLRLHRGAGPHQGGVLPL